MTDVSVQAIVKNRGVDVEFAVAAGEVLAVLGPNGAGKSTALHVIAGLVQPDTGVVRVGDRVLTDTSTGTRVATHDRRIGLLLQDPLLFPHLSVAANVAFSPRSSRADAARWLAEVEDDLADRMPRQLSGGQAQRIALARALAAEPDVLLLDEPMAGLDVSVAAAMRKLLRRVLVRDGRSALFDHPRPGRRADLGRPGADSGIRPDRRKQVPPQLFWLNRAATSGRVSQA